MTENFDPDDGASLPPLSTVFLSQRDLSLQVPINYVTQPGVSFSAACFPFLKYDDEGSGNCLSNLLAEGFRRLELDLYWDQGRQVWSFCPVAIPTTLPLGDPSSTTTFSFPSRSPSTRGPLVSDAAPTLGARQATTEVTDTSSAARSTATLDDPASGSSLGLSLPSISVPADSDDEPLIQIGPYVCTTTINLSTFTSQILDYLEKTETTLAAHLVYVILNLHAVASESAPTEPAPAVTDLPAGPALLGPQFAANLSEFIYTPSNLGSDRANLNASWYTVAPRYRPVEDYYTVRAGPNRIYTTEDGWPSESFIEFSRSKRLLLGYGTSDPQISGYNFTGDNDIIFPAGYLQESRNEILSTSSDHISRGCYVVNNTDDLSQVNSSWATVSNLGSSQPPVSSTAGLVPFLNLSTNATNCGISPILNFTLLNATADTNYLPYQNFSYSTIWSWAADEPKNSSDSDDDTSDSLFRCAAVNLELAGRWAVTDCSQKSYAACRADRQPYNWTLTTYATSYSFAGDACPQSYTFAAPRTSLENAYLVRAMRNSGRDFDRRGAWIDFNSLDVKGCWTFGGPNATCPYSDALTNSDDLAQQTVLVPIIAAVIVLIVTVLTVFVKVAGNRKTKKRRKRRAINGFVYEGVPS
ncbi:hypothetical protein PVAG01_09993 [Phlyctema vagabunda]|uniref:Maintenance of telomere capping protein 6 n=1 Tax=Phlyctema vagabunda TaxID=108571 RepID=A0ABR4P4P0_9HELO